MLFTDEVKDMSELIEKLATMNTKLSKIKVAAVCFIFDKDGNLILHRRGPGARDAVGKLQAIGGSVNNDDVSFRDALARELTEEAGNSANICVDGFVGALLDGKVDRYSGEYVDWIILAYYGTLESGELINSEPERCIGFEKAPLTGFSDEDLSDTAKIFIKQLIDIKK
ncbi:MAG: NUDIX hydrolase [Bacilli bacterium]|nr:NUDIX hydrolase [Bacilli bacterium]